MDKQNNSSICLLTSLDTDNGFDLLRIGTINENTHQKVIKSEKNAISLQNGIEVNQMHIKTWHDVNKVEDSLEKLIYPLSLDDEYNRGKVNEYQSQINCF